ncbi:ABC transporter permease subunit [Diplocloster agilis]|uniref:ABC transporter permease subunit n=1 Tax=Diplocloster agilis TaxID=2850323 RepID=UPI000821A19A|nr:MULTISPECIES: ABC transporter permease subunit [Lachnospiraceae]MBU9743419.1 ABC transporter permease subunit [Diplocloster agilis]MCU6733894.1 ABC transporter permease subunit [Suonthocola fibrivorans]SCJ14217.1 ABC-type transport system involved in multi-copper enzyme maturation%2C permease component [uncultured Clostridium sp.]
MLAILKREVKNYLKRPLFWIGTAIVILGVFQALSPYLSIHYLKPDEKIVNDYPEAVREGEVYEGYVPSSEEQKREIWEKDIERTLISEFKIDKEKAANLINEMKDKNVAQACEYLEKEYHYKGAIASYENAAYYKGTNGEINLYLKQKLEDKPFSYYFSRKFADFTGLFMGFFATLLLSVLFMQDTRKNTYELLHTKPIRTGTYILGKIAGGFSVCLLVLAVLNVVFWILCCAYTKSSGFEVHLLDFIAATCLYVLPNMLMILSVHGFLALLFKNPLPAVPLLILYMVYSNMGGRNADGVYGYYGRPLAIMVRFPGQLFDTAPPPMALLNQSFLILSSIVIIFISIQLWERRRI